MKGLWCRAQGLGFRVRGCRVWSFGDFFWLGGRRGLGEVGVALRSSKFMV